MNILNYRKTINGVVAKNTGISINIPGIAGLLTIVFVILKLLNYIAWSWWWVLSPLWLSFLFMLFLVALFVVIYAISYYYSKR